MPEEIVYSAEILLLLKILLAHIVSDFLLQTDNMVTTKKWFSKSMFLHLLIVGCTTLILSQNLPVTLLIVPIHFLVDGIKLELRKNSNRSDLFLFVLDQAMHLVSILVIWMIYCKQEKNILNLINYHFSSTNSIIILTGYVLVMHPIGYFIKLSTKNLTINNHKTESENDETIHAGLPIGIYERIIILTFVLLGKYEAIGFLITGKSIMRFVDKNSDIRSEYVLVGTMMSYALSIVIGVAINQIIS